MRLVESIAARMSEMAARGRSLNRHPRVAAIEWQEPLMAAGNWVPEMLEMLGCGESFRSRSRTFAVDAVEDSVASDAEVIIYIPAATVSSRPVWRCIGSRAVPGVEDLTRRP